MEKNEKGSHLQKEVLIDVEFKEGRSRSTMRAAETVLRVIPMALCLAALVIMLKNTQTQDSGSVSYSDLGGFKYLVYANGICAFYSLLSAFYKAVPRAPTLSWAWTIFFLDQILTYIVLAAGMVSAEVVYLANKGDEAITWSQACEVFGDFCAKATVSVGITFGSVACYMALSLISSYHLFSTYDSSISFRDNPAFENTAFPT